MLMVAGLTLECAAIPFNFPESEDRSRSLTQRDYTDYDFRLHHHNHHHQHHGGHNKRKKFKRKRRKKPCYYKTNDGRTFFWTGINIYETNVYVNPGGYPNNDAGSFGLGPCSSGSSSSEVDDGQQSPPGSLQSPQRPNRPFLQTLASYVPSGPTAWNWVQGIQWSNYIPSQQSFNSAVNNVVNSLPGFGSSRPRPPSIPVRPVTESPFTRPTDFTRPPTFTRPTQQPVYTRPTQQPVYTRPTQQPIYTRPTQQPIYTTRPTQRPVFTRPTSTSPPTSTGEDGSDENYDYSNFSSENTDNSADTSINGLGSAGNQQPSNQPASNIPTVGSIGNGIKPIYERPGKYFNDFIVKPFRGSIREVVSWF